MVALGIDPGTRRVGYGVVESGKGFVALRGAGLLGVKSKNELRALQEIRRGTEELIRAFGPAVLALERLYFVKNQKTGIQVAQARGVIAAAAMEQGVRVLEFGPSEVKLGITGYGLADKKSVLKMVRLILGEADLDVIDDASDALALAILATRSQAVDSG